MYVIVNRIIVINRKTAISWFMMSRGLIARWDQPLYELFSSISIDLVPGGTGLVHCIHTSLRCRPAILYTDVHFGDFLSFFRILYVLPAYYRSFYSYDRIALAFSSWLHLLRFLLSSLVSLCPRFLSCYSNWFLGFFGSISFRMRVAFFHRLF